MGFKDKMKAASQPQKTGRKPGDPDAVVTDEPDIQAAGEPDEATAAPSGADAGAAAAPTLVGAPRPAAGPTGTVAGGDRPADDTLVLEHREPDAPPAAPAAERSEAPAAPGEVDALLDDPTAPPGAVVEAPAEARASIVTPPPVKPAELRRQRLRIDSRRDDAVRELGGLVVEMARRERMRVDLLAHRAAIVMTLEDEIAAIDAALTPRPAPAPLAGEGAQTGDCHRCGQPLVPNANFCSFCGASTLVENAAQTDS